MPAKLHMLKLVPVIPEGQPVPSSSASHAVDEGTGRTNIPEARDMARWRSEADARMEDTLTRFDAAIVVGEDPALSAHELLHGFMSWTRSSLERFHIDARRPVDRAAWASERAVWGGLADLAAQDAIRDPAGVDRFLRIWLGVVHEASATGLSWLYVR